MSIFKFLIIFFMLPITAIGVLSCSPVRVLNTIASMSGGYSSTAGISYGLLNRQKLDIYTPRTSAPVNGWPVVVFFYGGSWNSGERSEYKFIGASLASRGVLTLVADYRLYPDVRYPGFLQDSALALAYGFDNAAKLGGNPKRIFVMGHSAGAYNAAMLALDSRWLSATGHNPQELAGWIGLAGPYDFFPTENPDAQPVFFHPHYPAKAQPIEFGFTHAAPTFLAASLKDKVVSPTRSTQALAEKLKAGGTSLTLHLYKHSSHTTLIGAFSAPLRGIVPVREDVLMFIDNTPPKR